MITETIMIAAAAGVAGAGLGVFAAGLAQAGVREGLEAEIRTLADEAVSLEIERDRLAVKAAKYDRIKSNLVQYRAKVAA